MPMRYTIVIEQSSRNYAAYVPDLPGCVATGASEAEVVREISTATVVDVVDVSG